MAQCPTCGSAVPEGAVVCPDCGMDLASAAVEPSPAAGLAPAPEWLAAEPAAPLAATPSPAAPSALAPAAAAARLTLLRGGVATSDTFVLGPRVVIGRFDPDSGPVDVDLGPLPEAVYVSRHHAEIRLDEAGQWRLSDLGSRNGTFVRARGQSQFQRAGSEHPLADGDEIALGNAQFVFQIT